jgi:hypothetical protein
MAVKTGPLKKQTQEEEQKKMGNIYEENSRIHLDRL